MSVYAIGDIQGCFDSFQELLDQIKFKPAKDELWLVGDLVNRGPKSLETLEWVYENRDNVRLVLGNHDLAMLASYVGVRGIPKGPNTTEAILSTKRCRPWLDWLMEQPLVFQEGPYLVVHGGFIPQWTVKDVLDFNRMAQAQMKADSEGFLKAVFASRNGQWTNASDVAAAVNVLARIRVCTEAGEVDFKFDGGPEQAPEGFFPWFDIQNRGTAGFIAIVGHWSALGLYLREDLIALDSGCVWGRQLSACRLDDEKLFQVASVE